MIRILIILLFICSTASAQTRVAFGGTRPIDTAWAARFLRIDSALRLLKYSTADSNKVLGFDANGNGILRTKGTGGGGGSADSTVFYTVYRSDTSRANIYAAIAAGGGSTPTLQQVTDVGDTTDNSITFKNNAETIFGSGGGILLDNSSRLREGTITSLNTGNKGIAQICGVGYELKWAEGSQYVMNGNGNAIRVVNYRFSDTPTSSNDNLQGFYVGSRWVLDNGITYVCTDATTGSSVWNRVSAITLTTTGTSGAATLTNDTLNIPQYAGATYTAGNRLGLNTDTFYLDTAGLFDYNFSAPSNLKIPTTAAVNSELANYVSATRLADTAAAIRAAYVPYTGATQDVDLGTKGLTAQWLMSDTVQSNTGNLHLHGTSGTGIVVGASGSVLFDNYPIAVTGDSVLSTNSAGALQRYDLKTKLATYLLRSDTATFVATRSWVNGRGFGTGTVTSIQLVAGSGVTITPTTAVTTSGVYTVSATGGSSGYPKIKGTLPVTITAGTGDTLVISLAPNTTQTITETTTINFPSTLGMLQQVTLTANDTIAIDSASMIEGYTYKLTVLQNVTGGKTLYWKDSYLKFSGGTTSTGYPYQDIGSNEYSLYYISKENGRFTVLVNVNIRN